MAAKVWPFLFSFLSKHPCEVLSYYKAQYHAISVIHPEQQKY